MFAIHKPGNVYARVLWIYPLILLCLVSSCQQRSSGEEATVDVPVSVPGYDLSIPGYDPSFILYNAQIERIPEAPDTIARYGVLRRIYPGVCIYLGSGFDNNLVEVYADGMPIFVDSVTTNMSVGATKDIVCIGSDGTASISRVGYGLVLVHCIAESMSQLGTVELEIVVDRTYGVKDVFDFTYRGVEMDFSGERIILTYVNTWERLFS